MRFNVSEFFLYSHARYVLPKEISCKRIDIIYNSNPDFALDKKYQLEAVPIYESESMNRKVNFFVFSLLYFYASLAVADAYRFNSLGFTPDSAKIATIIGECDSFSVCDSTTRQVVFSGTVEKSDLQSDVAQIGRYADFSVIKQPGRYYLEVEGLGRSHEFEIDKSVYSEPLKTAMRAASAMLFCLVVW